jgi:hypothetical protein
VALTRLQQDSIFYFIGHGGEHPSAIGLLDENADYALFKGRDIMDQNFPNLQLVVLNGCYMGKNPDMPGSVTQTFLNAGAKTVVGFIDYINMDYAQFWGDLFWEYALPDGSDSGLSILAAATNADREACQRWVGGDGPCEQGGLYAVYGDPDLRLDPGK